MKLYCAQEGQGPPLILVHGIFGSHANLGAIARPLSKRCCVYRLDLRNHGRSPHADSMSYAEMASDIVEFMDSQGLERSAVLGHSLGGKVMMELAMSNPARVSHLVVGDIAPVTYPSHQDPVLVGLMSIDLSTLSSRDQADASLASYVEDKTTRQFLLKNLQRDTKGQFSWRLNLKAIAQNYPQLRLAVGEGQHFHGPTLFIRGELSKYIQARNHAEIFERFPNARIETIPDAGHWLHVENPQRFTSLVLDLVLGS